MQPQQVYEVITQQTFSSFAKHLYAAIQERIEASQDPKKEILSLADLNRIIEQAIVGLQQPHYPGYPRKMEKDFPATNSGSLSQLQRGLGVPMKTSSIVAHSPAEEQQLRAQGWY